MHRSQCMMKTSMLCSWVHQVAQPQLLNVTQPLKVRVLNQIIDQFILNGDETIHRVVNDFLFVQSIGED